MIVFEPPSGLPRVSLPPNLTSLVQSRIEAGVYQTGEEVLTAALDALAEREKKADVASIKRGLAQAEAGLGVPAEVSNAERRQRYGLEKLHG